MSGRLQWTAFLAFCAGGWAGFALLFPTSEASGKEWRTTASRAEVIAAARKIALEYGVDTADWDFSVTAQSSRARRLARVERPNSPLAASFPSMEYVVVASRSGTPSKARIVLANDLRPLAFRSYVPRRRPDGKGPEGKRPDGRGRGAGWRMRGEQGPGPRPEGPPPGAYRTPVDISSQLALYAGANAGRYRQTSFAAPTPEGLRSAWEWTDEASPGIVARLQVFVRRGRIHRAEHELEIAPDVIASRLSPYELPHSFAAPARPLLIAGTLFICFWYLFRSLARTFVPLRFALAVMPMVLIPLLADFLLGPDADRTVISALDQNTTTSAASTAKLAGIGLACAGFAVALASGRSILPQSQRPLWLSLQYVYLRKPAARRVGVEMLAGLAAGPAIAAVTYILQALSGREDVLARMVSTPMFLTAEHPWAAALGEAVPWIQVPSFGFVAVWLFHAIRRRWLAGALLALYGAAAVLLYMDPLPGSRPLAIGSAALVFLAMWFTWRSCGLLGVLMSSFSAPGAVMSGAFLGNGMKAEALSAAAPVVLMALAGAGVALFGRREDAAEGIASFEIQPRERIISERARLDAEFAVATAAQQRLLPAAPPKVDGYSIAGSCIPAQEVGGDLFDYAPAPSGKLALCVADVSGKGVPAALYMTLTKGMLSSAQPDLAHLPTLVSRLNKHLLATGKRKTFVTMSIALLDPRERRLTHVRAGHNPPLLYRAAARTWELLKPRGLGLGLASPAAFDPLLEEQTVELHPGDVVVFYSDGLTEMMNPERELFGEERLGEVVRENAGGDARQIHDGVLEAAREFQSGAEQHDDLTLVVLKAEYSLS